MTDRSDHPANGRPVEGAEAASTAAPGTASQASSQAPGAGDANSSRQASAGMPSPRALETGARGWRWRLTSSLLVMLPILAFADEPRALHTVDHRLAVADGLVATKATLELGTPLATPAQARAYLTPSATAPAAAGWADVYFTTAAKHANAETLGSAFVTAHPGQVALGSLSQLDR